MDRRFRGNRYGSNDNPSMPPPRRRVHSGRRLPPSRQPSNPADVTGFPHAKPPSFSSSPVFRRRSRKGPPAPPGPPPPRFALTPVDPNPRLRMPPPLPTPADMVDTVDEEMMDGDMPRHVELEAVMTRGSAGPFGSTGEETAPTYWSFDQTRNKHVLHRISSEEDLFPQVDPFESVGTRREREMNRRRRLSELPNEDEFEFIDVEREGAERIRLGLDRANEGSIDWRRFDVVGDMERL